MVRNPWGVPADDTLRDRFQQVLLSRLLAPADTDRLLAANRFVVNTDWNRFLEYATPRYALGHHPWQLVNLLAFGRDATFPGHDLEGDWPPERRAWTQLDAARYRSWLGLPEASPPGPSAAP